MDIENNDLSVTVTLLAPSLVPNRRLSESSAPFDELSEKVQFYDHDGTPVILPRQSPEDKFAAKVKSLNRRSFVSQWQAQVGMHDDDASLPLLNRNENEEVAVSNEEVDLEGPPHWKSVGEALLRSRSELESMLSLINCICGDGVVTNDRQLKEGGLLIERVPKIEQNINESKYHIAVTLSQTILQLQSVASIISDASLAMRHQLDVYKDAFRQLVRLRDSWRLRQFQPPPGKKGHRLVVDFGLSTTGSSSSGELDEAEVVVEEVTGSVLLFIPDDALFHAIPGKSRELLSSGSVTRPVTGADIPIALRLLRKWKFSRHLFKAISNEASRAVGRGLSSSIIPDLQVVHVSEGAIDIHVYGGVAAGQCIWSISEPNISFCQTEDIMPLKMSAMGEVANPERESNEAILFCIALQSQFRRRQRVVRSQRGGVGVDARPFPNVIVGGDSTKNLADEGILGRSGRLLAHRRLVNRIEDAVFAICHLHPGWVLLRWTNPLLPLTSSDYLQVTPAQKLASTLTFMVGGVSYSGWIRYGKLFVSDGSLFGGRALQVDASSELPCLLRTLATEALLRTIRREAISRGYRVSSGLLSVLGMSGSGVVVSSPDDTVVLRLATLPLPPSATQCSDRVRNGCFSIWVSPRPDDKRDIADAPWQRLACGAAAVCDLVSRRWLSCLY